MILSIFYSSLYSVPVKEFETFNTTEVYQLHSIPNTDIHNYSNKKFFRIGKKIIRNPFYKSSDKFLKDKVSTICIILLTGPLGGHRLYLGTKPIVPVVYAVTLGGGIGILPVIDMFVIIFTKDLNRYIDNDRIIMWIE